MNGAELFSYSVLGCGVLALAVQYGIAKGEQRREQRIERQRAAESKTLLEFVALAWKQQK